MDQKELEEKLDALQNAVNELTEQEKRRLTNERSFLLSLQSRHAQSSKKAPIALASAIASVEKLIHLG